MKLASLKHGRDGRLVVVSSDLAWYADASAIVPTLQAALDDWDRVEDDLRNLATDLDHDVIPKDRFHERDAASPLPRAKAANGPPGLDRRRSGQSPGPAGWPRPMCPPKSQASAR